jgi:polar amino acid transport system substrate-binding protein
MTRRTLAAAIALCLIAVFAMGLIVACGSSDDNSSTSANSSAGTGAMTGSAADRAQTILGHAPTGLAQKIVDKGAVIVANDAAYPPQSSIDKATGKMVGFDVDVANAMGEILGLQVQFQNPSWATIPAGINQGKYDVSIGSMTSAIDGKQTDPVIVKRLTQLDFTDPYYYNTAQVFVKQGGPQITGPADLDGKRVGVGASTTYESYLDASTKATVVPYPTDADTFPDLRNGNLDFVMTAGATGQQAIQDGQPFEFSGQPLYYEDLSMAIKKGEADWLALLNYAVQAMHKDGSLTAMSEKWYNGLDLTVKQ